MKISFIFFRALFYLICIYKVQAIFWNFLNRLKKVLTSRDTCHTPKGFGWVSRCGLRETWHAPKEFRRVALGLGTRDTWHTRNASGGIFSRREASGTRGELGRHPEGGSRLGFSGHVASSGGSRGKFSRLESLGTRGVSGECPGC